MREAARVTAVPAARRAAPAWRATGEALATPATAAALARVVAPEMLEAPALGVGRRRMRAYDRAARYAVLGALACAALGCARGGNRRPAAVEHRPYWTNSPERCPVDHVREYYCDELLPMTSALPAPSPYENCPTSIESHSGMHEPVPPIAVFDVGHTDRTRARMPPGHTCCYSWCARLKVVPSAGLAALTPCERPVAFREHYCMPELESPSSVPAGGAFSNCAAGIVPPPAIAFEVPSAAYLDPVRTLQLQSRGVRECCYGWCSKVPGTSGLERLF